MALKLISNNEFVLPASPKVTRNFRVIEGGRKDTPKTKNKGRHLAIVSEPTHFYNKESFHRFTFMTAVLSSIALYIGYFCYFLT